MFSPVLSHLATEATSHYAWALAMTIIIIITTWLRLKNQSTHLADGCLNDLLKREMAPVPKPRQHSFSASLTLLIICSHPHCPPVSVLHSVELSLHPLWPMGYKEHYPLIFTSLWLFYLAVLFHPYFLAHLHKFWQKPMWRNIVFTFCSKTKGLKGFSHLYMKHKSALLPCVIPTCASLFPAMELKRSWITLTVSSRDSEKDEQNRESRCKLGRQVKSMMRRR